MVLTTEGIDAGRYQFSPTLLENARDLYLEVKNQPYQPSQAYVNGLYETYFFYPGPLLPHSIVMSLPLWCYEEYLEQAAWQWIVTVISALSLLLLWPLRVFLRRVGEQKSELTRRSFGLLHPAAGLTLAFFLEIFLRDHVFLTGEPLQWAMFSTRLLALYFSATGIVHIGNVLSELALSRDNTGSPRLNQQLVRLVGRIFSVTLAVVIVIEGMQRIGFSLATLVAGAGVSGLAIALAAQNTFKNILSGVELSLDRPFSEGQRFKLGNIDGIVEQVGLRSTRLRTLTGHQITVPNEVAANTQIENVARRPYIRRTFNVTITYDTPPDKIVRALAIIKQILALPEEAERDQRGEPHPNQAIHQGDLLPKVFFNDLNPDSLNIAVFYWYHPPEYWRYMAHAQWVNLQIMECFAEEGIDFAFPTQTLHLAGDDKRPLDVGSIPLDARPQKQATTADAPWNRASAKVFPAEPAEDAKKWLIEEELLRNKPDEESNR